MKGDYSFLLAISFGLFPVSLMANCWSGSDIVVFGQLAYVKKKPSMWQIDGKAPYTTDNLYNDFAGQFSNKCQLIENKLSTEFSLYALAYSSYNDVGSFEKDNHRMRGEIDRLSLSYMVSESIGLDMGKLRETPGVFYLKSPASLMANYYSGFKPTRIYHPAMKLIYPESFWGAKLSADSPGYSLSLTAVPKLTDIDKRYESSGNWSAAERSNATEAYLVRYIDHRFTNNSPSASFMAGRSRSIAFSNSVNYTPQFIINAEIAYHFNQQWRHFDTEQADKVKDYLFPSSLYRKADDNGIELALGVQYTTDRFSVFGMEYYFQSESYSRAEWQKQIDLIQFLNQRTYYEPLDKAFDAYKYLMGAEINNVSNKGRLQGKHYINAYASILMENQSSIQPYAVINLLDKSTMLGIHYNKPLTQIESNLDIYTGIYGSLGRKDSEFALFGETIGIYSGFKYHF